jgi:hypothetical protein
VKIILSHIPITNTVDGSVSQEGAFTQEGGGSQVFLDRQQSQEEIVNLLNEVFASTKTLTFEQFSECIQNNSSEMFLALLLLIQSSLPCSENFNRYKKNYEKYLLSNPDAKDKPWSAEEIKMVASPRLMSKLSPITGMNLDGSQINLNPQA